MADEIKTLKVGVAQSDITPPIGTCLAGYFNKRVSTGIIHPLRAKAIVAGSGDERVALITCDLITMTAEVCQRVRKIVHDATGILESHVMICSTHTHTGPDLRPSNANCPRNEEYYEGVPARIAQAAIDAANSQKDAVMCIGTEQEEGLACVRRFRMENCSEQFGPGGALKCEGPASNIDPIFGAIVFKEELNAKPFAVICNYTVHIDVTGGTLISADFPAVIQETLQKVYGDDLIVLYVQGACGNINHCPYLQNCPYPGKGVWKSEQMGRAFAGKAMAIIEKAYPSKSVDLGTVSEILDVPKYPKNDYVVQMRLAQARAKQNTTAPGGAEAALLERYDAYSDEGTIKREVQAMRFGDAVFCGAPGELFVEWGFEIKKWSKAKYTFIAELCDDAVGYIPTFEAFLRGGYESTPIVSVRSTPALGQMIADANFRNIRKLFPDA